MAKPYFICFTIVVAARKAQLSAQLFIDNCVDWATEKTQLLSLLENL